MKINKEIGKEVEKIFDAKKKFHIKQAKLPIEEKIKNPDRTSENWQDRKS